jgi:tetratricopeptide (TPR) repeat protein
VNVAPRSETRTSGKELIMGKRLLITIVSGVLGLAVFGAAVPLAVHAAGGGGGGDEGRPSAKPQDPDYTAAVAAIKAGDYARAIPLLDKVVERDGKNADAYNWLAYATRRNGDPAKAIGIYEQALALDPKHRGAHEYIGEAYLALNDLANAKQHLATLDSLCFLPCSEYTDLKKAIQEYEKNGGTTKPSAGR